MSDDFLHTGRADIHHPKGPLTGQAARSECAEGCAWASHMRGGEPLYVQICMLCERINWVDLAEQVARVRAAVAEDLAQLVESLCPARDSAHLGDHCDFRLAAVAIREHAAALSVRPDTDRTPDVGTSGRPEELRPAQSLGDHPHTDPGDGRTECRTCGKWVFEAIHSCKRVPVTPAAIERAQLAAGSVPSLSEETPDA